MPEKLDDLADNVRDLSVWVRVSFVIVFVVALHLIIGPLIVLLALAQGLFLIFTARVNENLASFGSLLTAYVAQILSFVTFNSERRPFPFSDFPEEHAGASADFTSSQSARSAQSDVKLEESGRDRKPTKKSQSKKKPVRKKKFSNGN